MCSRRQMCARMNDGIGTIRKESLWIQLVVVNVLGAVAPSRCRASLFCTSLWTEVSYACCIAVVAYQQISKQHHNRHFTYSRNVNGGLVVDISFEVLCLPP